MYSCAIHLCGRLNIPVVCVCLTSRSFPHEAEGAENQNIKLRVMISSIGCTNSVSGSKIRNMRQQFKKEVQPECWEWATQVPTNDAAKRAPGGIGREPRLCCAGECVLAIRRKHSAE